MTKRKIEDLKSSIKQYNDAYKEWNQPEKRLAEIREFAESILSKPTIEIKRRGREGWALTDEQHIALKIRISVDEMQKAIDNQDARAAAIAGIKLDLALSEHDIKTFAIEPKKKAAAARHKERNQEKEIWLEDALAQLKTTVEEKADNRAAWKHMDYVRHLQKDKKYKDVPQTWQEELRVKFIDRLYEINRTDLVRGVRRRG